MQSILVPGTLESLSTVGQFVNSAANVAGLDKKKAYKLRLAVDEILTNIIIHGYEEAGLSGDVSVTSALDEQQLSIVLEDSSGRFDPRSLGRPAHLDKPVEERPVGGLGIYLTLENVDRFDYEYVNQRNRNIFIVNRPMES